ncbi:hypothetical protein KDW_04210 [Dictyobacter vulcani]|uniref:Uncharacterized protein n=1 Tax=Dictyobacter vulcani TaxID=2607529 RepID=A0A5J4KJ63_9CHLR|nr:hypothetical protein [Dictyobacter vulcani]GER86259.1 hypothetical protein KDW_04210 [Dictyobacter vulcani]
MQIEDFQRSLQRGLGRIILYLQEHDATPYQEYILDACLHNNTYDPQSEGNKAQYLYEIIQLTHKESFYREAILHAMATIPPPISEFGDDLDWDVSQFFDFGLIFAQQGDKEARQAMYQLFLKRATRGCEFGAYDLIDLDGLDGFLFVARHLYHIAGSPKDQLDRWYLKTIEERFGHESVLHYIEQATTTEPLLTSFINYPREQKTTLESGDKHVIEDYEYARQLIAEWKVKSSQERQYGAYNLGRLAFWGRRATDETLLLAANDLLNTTSDNILPYLAIFRNRPFPLDYRDVLQWTRNENADIAAQALAALVPVHGPAVRALALQLIHDPERIGDALDLLINNYQEGDHLLIEQFLANLNDPDDFHNTGYSILKIFEQNPTKDCQQALIQLYERDPCAYCREKAVRLLTERQVFPDWMAQECLHDSRPGIREKAQLWLNMTSQL